MMTSDRMRQHAAFLRNLAADYRVRAKDGPQEWQEKDAREADRLESDADWWMQRAARWEGQGRESFDDAA